MLIKGKGITVQYRLPFEIDLLLNDLKELKRENKILEKENYKQRQTIFLMLKVIVKYLSRDGRAPNLQELKKIIGIDIRNLYPLHAWCYYYKDLVKQLNLRIGRRRRTKT